VDAEQIRREMTRTRASIDRKLDELSVRTTAAKQEAVRRGVAVGMLVAAAVIGLLWRRHANA
jgi:hypothetical protein